MCSSIYEKCFCPSLQKQYMEQNKTDRALLFVGILLVIAVIAWIAAGIIIPAKPSDTGKGQKKFGSTGKVFGTSSYCQNEDLASAECQSEESGGCLGQKQGNQATCFQSGNPSCSRS